MKLHPLLSMRPGQRFETQVLRSRPLTPSTHGIEIEKPAGFEFQPTQFTFLQLETPEDVEVHPMSLATSTTRPHLEYGARVSNSAFKRAFVALRPGDKVLVQGPLGHYILDQTRPAVLLAGGIGITPLKGMAEYAADRKLPIPMRLIYSNRDESEIVYREELDELERRNPMFKMTHTLTRPTPGSWQGKTGRVNAGLIAEVSNGLGHPVFYLCGAPGFVKGCQESLLGSGTPETDIRVELFRGYGASA